jgi:hypothetical protein
MMRPKGRTSLTYPRVPGENGVLDDQRAPLAVDRRTALWTRGGKCISMSSW